MMKVSLVNEKAQAYIQQKLKAIEEEHHVRILLAIESGSRAWGFPSKNSDYDIRFIYARSLDDYLSIEAYRDVIETPLIDDPILDVPLDLNGWDIRKVLQLTTKSNAVLLEWLTSPIRYQQEPQITTELLKFAKNCANLSHVAYHYNRLVNNAWELIVNSDGHPKLKLYCYALRPALALEWIRQFHETPPMDMYSLCNRIKLDQTMLTEIKTLLSLKTFSDESDCISRMQRLDTFILTALQTNVEKQSITPLPEKILNEANQLFRKFIQV